MGFSNDWAGNDRTNNYASAAPIQTSTQPKSAPHTIYRVVFLMKLITAFHTPVD